MNPPSPLNTDRLGQNIQIRINFIPNTLKPVRNTQYIPLKSIHLSLDLVKNTQKMLTPPLL